jgi:hypothetical protein
VEVLIMRAITVLSALAALTGAVLIAGTAAAKGPFRAEISGGDLAEPVTIEGPLPVELVFAYDAVEAAPPESLEPAYTIKLMPEAPDGATGEYPVLMTLTYFPGQGDAPALLRGDWDNGDRYFEASPEFQAVLEDAIGAAKPSEAAAGNDGVSAIWYIAPSLAAVGLMLIGGLAGRRLLFRHDE